MGTIGVIGGSGLYEIDGVKVLGQKKVETPFGMPSGDFTIAEFQGKQLVFLPRHDKGHTILPSELNYRANIYGMKKMGVDRIISLSACGSFKEHMKPRDIVIVDQFVDRTNAGRIHTFFGEGIVAHVSLAEPVCGELARIMYGAAKKTSAGVHMGGTYINIEGPTFSTKAESLLYKSWGMDVIGMTNMPEAQLAREAEICYTSVAFVTDYDAWHESEEPVTAEMIVENLTKNVENAKQILKDAVAVMPEKRQCGCQSALKGAIFTNPKYITDTTKRRLDLIIGKYIK